MNVRSFAKSLIALGAIALSSYFIEVHLHRKGVPGRDLILLSNLMVGLVGAALVYVLSLRERQRQQYVECRLRVIAEMNHHIRNALQVITFYTRKGQKQEVGSWKRLSGFSGRCVKYCRNCLSSRRARTILHACSKFRSSGRRTRVRLTESLSECLSPRTM